MKRELDAQTVVRSSNPWLGVLFAAAFTLFAAGMTIVATTALTRDGIDAGSGVFLAVFWSAVAFLLAWTLRAALWAARYGRSTLRLDASPLHLGQWVSGVVEVPATIGTPILQLSVECTRESHGMTDDSRILWHEAKIVDGATLSRHGQSLTIPFSVRLPDEGTPSQRDRAKRVRVTWFLDVKANARPVKFETRFELVVHPRVAGFVVSEAPPRPMQEVAAAGLPSPEALVERVGDVEVIRMPFPVVPASLLFVFIAIAVAAVFPGLPWSGTFDDGHFAAVAVSGFLAAMTLVVLSLTVRSVEVGAGTVRVRRGLFGIGFHSTIAMGDIEAVETRPPDPDDSPAYHKVDLRTRKGARIPAATRLKDEAEARAMAHLLRRSILGET